MAIHFTTAPIPEWEEELELLEDEFDREYYLECRKEYIKFEEELCRVDQLQLLYDEMASYPLFTRFCYDKPDELYWDTPELNLKNTLELFVHTVDVTTFLTLQLILGIDDTEHRPYGHLSFSYDEVQLMFSFAERYADIKEMHEEKDKFIVWIVSRMMEFLL